MMNMHNYHGRTLVCCLAAVLLWAVGVCALQPPQPGEIEELRARGELAQRLEAAHAFGNHLPRAARMRHVQESLARLTCQPLPPPEPQPLSKLPDGMPTIGTNKILILCIAFADRPNTVSYHTVTNMVFGTGTPGNYPRESLQRYYQRSSYGQLLLEGTVLGWYTCTNNRSFYKPDGAAYDNYANYLIIKEALDYFDAQGHDFSQYDNDGDGYVDYFAVYWTGPVGAWATFWWGYQWSLYSADLRKDGVRFYDFSWQWEASSPLVLIHETGHALGLPDYYDYDSSVGPRGGVGGLDIMDGNKGDHNCFSKFMLGWVEPTFVTTSLYAYPQRASAWFRDAVLMMPGTTNGAQAFNEYFMMQNRYRTGNDTNMPGSGFLIWHVDATPTVPGGTRFRYNNSYTDRKLLRLMEADGLEQIEAGGAGNAGDYYQQGHEFSTVSMPSSRRYDGSRTGIRVRNFSPTAVQMSADFSYGAPSLALSATNITLTPPYGGSDLHTVIVSNRGDETLEMRLSAHGNYAWRDSRQSGGPAYAWHDISASGTSVARSDDGVVGPFPLGFAFPFYGIPRTQFHISMNGVITFDTASVPYDNTALPGSTIAGALLAPWWDDLNPSVSGAVRYLSQNGRLTVSWLGVPTYGENTLLKSFQAIIESNGIITFQYQTMPGSVSSATIGIQGANSTSAAVQVVYNGLYVTNDLAVRFTPPALPAWLSVTPQLAAVPPGAACLVSVTGSAAGQSNGVYTAHLVLAHNDPERAADVPLIVSMVVPEPAAALVLVLALAMRRCAGRRVG